MNDTDSEEKLGKIQYDTNLRFVTLGLVELNSKG
jgi:hypothetical protein